MSPKTRLNFEVYGQGAPITPEAGEKKVPFLSFIMRRNDLKKIFQGKKSEKKILKKKFENFFEILKKSSIEPPSEYFFGKVR